MLASNKFLNSKGNGLGLYICRLICKSLGGNIDVETANHQGAKFKFWVPLKAERSTDDTLMLSEREPTLNN